MGKIWNNLKQLNITVYKHVQKKPRPSCYCLGMDKVGSGGLKTWHGGRSDVGLPECGPCGSPEAGVE